MLTNFWKPLIFQFAYASNLVMNSKMRGLEEQTWSTFGMLLVLDFSRFPDLCHTHIPYHSAWFFGKHCNFEYVEIAPDSRTKGSRCPALHQDGSQSELNACFPTVIVLSQGKWWYPCDGTLHRYSNIHLVSIVGIHWVYPLCIFPMILAVHRFCNYTIFAKLFFTDIRPFRIRKFQRKESFGDSRLGDSVFWKLAVFPNCLPVGGNSNSFGIFTPKIGEDEPNLTHIFQMGWWKTTY